jgi:hypothetical protein
MSDRLARWVSVLFDRSVISLPIFLIFGLISAGISGLLWAVLILLIVTGIPLAYLLIGINRGWVSDLDLSNSEERPNFLLVSVGSDLLALGILRLTNGPHLFEMIVLTYLFLAIVIFNTSMFWDISLHMAGLGGFSTALVFVFGTPALLAFLSLPLFAWARLRYRKHTPLQLVAGSAAGIAVTLFVFGTTGKGI